MRVFILGAGFSHGLGYPLERQLIDEIIRYWTTRIQHDHVEALSGLRETLANFDQRNANEIGLEELFEFIATVFMPYLLLRHQQEPDPRPLSDQFRLRTRTQAMMREAVSAVAAILHGCEGVESRQPIDRFATSLTQDDVVITLNYDTAVERAIRRCGRTPDLGFRGTDDLTTSKEDTRVLKLHGSIDWTATCPEHSWNDTSPPNQLYSGPHVDGDDDDYQDSLDPPDRERLWRLDEETQLSLLIDGHLRNSQGTTLRPALAGLGLEKNPGAIPGMGHIHALAHWLLRRADSVVVVGYSFPTTDRYISHLLRTAFDRRMGSNGPRIRIVDPNPQGVLQNMRITVRECVLDTRRMEDITDWGKL